MARFVDFVFAFCICGLVILSCSRKVSVHSGNTEPEGIRIEDYDLTEAELTQSLGVSKTSVREAIKMLQAMGIVEVKRGQRTRIREHIEDDAINPLMFQLLVEKGTATDILNFRLMFEQAFTLMAMEYATEEDIKRIQETLRRFEQRIERGFPKAEDDLAFHYAILESTHNSFVIRTGTTILQLFKASIGESVQDHPQVALEDHTRIFSAFCRKDENAVKEAIMKSFERWTAFLQREFERDNDR